MKKSRLDYESPQSEVFVVHIEGGLCQSANVSTSGVGKGGYKYYYGLDEDEEPNS